MYFLFLLHTNVSSPQYVLLQMIKKKRKLQYVQFSRLVFFYFTLLAYTNYSRIPQTSWKIFMWIKESVWAIMWAMEQREGEREQKIGWVKHYIILDFSYAEFSIFFFASLFTTVRLFLPVWWIYYVSGASLRGRTKLPPSMKMHIEEKGRKNEGMKNRILGIML